MSDTVTKLLLTAITICLAILIWRIGSPLQLQIVGPFQSGGTSGIPIALNVDRPYGDRYDLQVGTDHGVAVVVRIDRATGQIDVYRIEDGGKLRQTDRTQ